MREILWISPFRLIRLVPLHSPSYEFFPTKGYNNGLQIHSKFLADALNSNLFPVMYLLTSGKVYVAANTVNMIFNWKTGAEQRLPNFPNGIRVTYPWTAASALLPLTVANDWTPEIMFCGGSTIDDTKDAITLSSQAVTSKQCQRMQLNTAGIAKGWQVEQLPTKTGRVMGEMVLTPDGKVVILNGANTGIAGYGASTKQFQHAVLIFRLCGVQAMSAIWLVKVTLRTLHSLDWSMILSELVKADGRTFLRPRLLECEFSPKR